MVTLVEIKVNNGGNNNKENIKEYRNKNKEFTKEYNKKYHKENKNHLKEYNKKYYLNNKSRITKRINKWRKTKNGKKSRIKEYTKRKQFGFNPLNDWFEDSHFHHIHINNPNDGYFIPSKLHKSIWHSHEDKESMDRINKAVMNWYENNRD